MADEVHLPNRRQVATGRAVGLFPLALLVGLVGAAPIPAEPGAARRDPHDHWAYRPLARPDVPITKDATRIRNPVDAFVVSTLEARGLRPNPPAAKRVLIRRVYFDLTGLPPTPEEVAAFLADASTDAYDKLVDRLLASPRYGERWARHWLDVVHYGESHGFGMDRPRPST